MKRLRVKLLSILLVFAVLMVNAEIPVGYYTGLNGKTTSELKTALCNIIYDHTPVSSYQALPNYFQKTDVRPNGTEWWEMYSNETFSYPSFSGMNREHSVPKSWWGGTTSIPAYTDLNHLYPSEMSANTAKSNYPLGEVSGTPTIDNGVSKVELLLISLTIDFVCNEQPDNNTHNIAQKTTIIRLTILFISHPQYFTYSALSLLIPSIITQLGQSISPASSHLKHSVFPSTQLHK